MEHSRSASERNIAVFGGAGLLGHRVVADLRKAGMRVIAIGRNGQPKCDIAIDVDVVTDVELRSLLSDIGSLDLIVNAIGVLRGPNLDDCTVSRMVVVNALWPRRLAIASELIEVPLVHVSTDAVFASGAGAVDEDSHPTPDDHYGAAKLLGEPASPWAISLRCSVIGPDPLKKKGIWEWVVGQQPNTAIEGFSDQLWVGVTSAQLAALISHLTEVHQFKRLRDESAVHHICPNASITKYDLVSKLAGVLRPDIEVSPRVSGRPVVRELATRCSATDLILSKGTRDWEDVIRHTSEVA